MLNRKSVIKYSIYHQAHYQASFFFYKHLLAAMEIYAIMDIIRYYGDKTWMN